MLNEKKNLTDAHNTTMCDVEISPTVLLYSDGGPTQNTLISVDRKLVFQQDHSIEAFC